MASVHDVAAYILQQHVGPISTWKLQKLVYYAQAWHLVWDDEPLFNEAIEAWANGPVVWELFDTHRGMFSVASWPQGDAGALTMSEKETVDSVLNGYGDLTGRQLSHLTHNEDPWMEAREGLGLTTRSNRPISLATMQAFYGALDVDDDAQAVEDIDWQELGA